MRSILPRVHLGAAKGATWVDSITTVGKQGDADVTAEGVLLGQVSESDSNLTVNVEAAGMTIPIVQHGTVKVDRIP
jgi:hypothetical protein